ncbi:MAG TPA: indole-3-glycerol phosphate synthase TrpC [Polyangia bacterium]|nr:indole-3-glycerol phosphate synthase TrpC [Polyangia bacterium]HVY37243.1 indole-3-glycerol phosphate synthase TrpC [Polyangia bacterium]
MILDDILARTRADLESRRAGRPLASVEAAAAQMPPARSLARALRQPGAITCIAEFKRRSPSAGWIAEGADPAAMARAYAAGGARAMSVLTDGPFFGGNLADLGAARAACPLPVLRKDFVVDRYQIVEARAAGADAVLLIVAALDDPTLRALLAASAEAGLDALVEAHDAAEVARALDAGATIVGINNRDLRTFTVDRELAVRLRAGVPADRIVVAESGIRDAADVARLRAAGVDAMLVGETLMRAPDPAAALKALAG